MRLASIVLLLAVAACHSSAASGPEWTCAAFCVTQYRCTEDGDSTSEGQLVSSEGATAAAAYRALANKCKGPHGNLVTSAHCSGGRLERHGAPLAQACAKR